MAHRFRFGDYLLDPARRELFHRGEAVMLPPKPFECLVYLAEHRDRAVGRDELIAAVWGKVEITDALLGQTLLRARRAVGDDGKAQSVVRTVARFGYRWVADTEVVPAVPLPDEAKANDPLPPAGGQANDGAADDEVHASPSVRVRLHRSGRPGLVVVLVLLAVVVLLAIAFVQRRANTPATVDAVAPDLVVVLPAATEGLQPEDAWLRLGLMDFIASRLRASGTLRVVPHEQAMQLVDAGDLPTEATAMHVRIAAITGAQRLLQPRVVRRRHGWSVTLTEYAGDRQQVWEGSGSVPLEAAVQALRSMQVRDREGPPGALVEAVQRIDSSLLVGELDEAQAMLARARQAWPDAVELQLRVARIDSLRGRIDAARDGYTALASKGEALVPTLRGEALIGLGRIGMRTGRYAEAEMQFKAAIATLQASGDGALLGRAYTGLGVARGAQDDLDQASEAFGQAREWYERAGDRLGVARVNANLGEVELRRGRPENAVRRHELALDVLEQYGERSDALIVQANLAQAYLASLDPGAALEVARQAWRAAADSGNPALRFRVGDSCLQALIANGRLGEAGELLARLDADAGKPDAAPGTRPLQAHRRVRAEYRLETGDYAAAAAENGALVDAARAAFATGDAALGEPLAQVAVVVADESGDIRTLNELVAIGRGAGASAAGLADLASARLAWREGRPDAARQALEASSARLADAGKRLEEMQVLLLQGSLALHEGDRARMRQLSDRLAPSAARMYPAAWLRLHLLEALGDTEAAARLKPQVRRLAGERDIARTPPGLLPAARPR